MSILTQAECNKLKIELERLLNAERPKISNDLKDAISQGDLSENAAYTDAKDRQAALEGRITEIKTILASAEIVGEKISGEKIEIGSTFRVHDKESDRERVFRIVGSRESSPQDGKISFDSPLGSAFLGRKQGDEVEILTPAGKRRYKVIEVL